MTAARLDARQLALDFAAEPPPAAAPPRPQAPVARSLLLDSAPIPYRLRRARRRSIGFRIDDDGLTVSAPRWVTLREIEAAIAEKRRWIETKLVQWREHRQRRRVPAVRFADGGHLPYLGQTLVLRLAGQSQATTLQGAELHVALPPAASEAQVRDAVQSWLQAQARRVLGERLEALAARNAVRHRGWALSSARTQWGSCTHDGRIRLNWRLIHFAPDAIDYVIAHELAHLAEMNHSARFWQRVGELLPGFEAARASIKGVELAALADDP
ncbi:MAG: M48 family metallopeptidase [Betaproteobacteria bacterium]